MGWRFKIGRAEFKCPSCGIEGSHEFRSEPKRFMGKTVETICTCKRCGYQGDEKEFFKAYH